MTSKFITLHCVHVNLYNRIKKSLITRYSSQTPQNNACYSFLGQVLSCYTVGKKADTPSTELHVCNNIMFLIYIYSLPQVPLSNININLTFKRYIVHRIVYTPNNTFDLSWLQLKRRVLQACAKRPNRKDRRGVAQPKFRTETKHNLYFDSQDIGMSSSHISRMKIYKSGIKREWFHVASMVRWSSTSLPPPEKETTRCYRKVRLYDSDVMPERVAGIIFARAHAPDQYRASICTARFYACYVPRIYLYTRITKMSSPAQCARIFPFGRPYTIREILARESQPGQP